MDSRSDNFKIERGGALTRKQYDLVVNFLKTSERPPVSQLKEADLLKDNKKCSRFFKLHSIAKRTMLTGDGALMFRANKKLIVPREDFVSIIKSVHEGKDGTGKHLMFSATLAELSCHYTLGRRQFGIGEELVRKVVQSCKKSICVRRWRNIMKRRTTQIPDSVSETTTTADVSLHNTSQTTVAQSVSSTVVSSYPVAVQLTSTGQAFNGPYTYQPCQNHGSVYQLVQVLPNDVQENKSDITEIEFDEYSLPQTLPSSIPVQVELPDREHGEGSVNSESMIGTNPPVPKSYLVGTYVKDDSSSGSCGGSLVLSNNDTLNMSASDKLKQIICIVARNGDNKRCLEQSTSTANSCQTNMAKLGVPLQKHIMKLPMFGTGNQGQQVTLAIQQVSTSSTGQTRLRKLLPRQQSWERQQKTSLQSLLQTDHENVFKMDTSSENKDAAVGNSDTESDEFEMVGMPTPFPHMWHSLKDVNSAPHHYARISSVIQDARIDLKRSFVDCRAPLDRLKKKMEFLHTLIRQQKIFTSRFIGEDD